MPRDFAKQPKNKRRRPAKKTNAGGTPKLLWFITFIVIIVFIAGLVYLHKHKWHSMKQQIQRVNNKTSTHKIAKGQMPHFEFYNMLTKNSNNAKQPTKSKTPNVPVISLNPIKNSAQYSVQIASFKQQQAAKQLQAKLILRGMDVKTKRSQGWYRVSAGPYKDQSTAKQIAQQLKKSGYKSLVRTIK